MLAEVRVGVTEDRTGVKLRQGAHQLPLTNTSSSDVSSEEVLPSPVLSAAVVEGGRSSSPKVVQSDGSDSSSALDLRIPLAARVEARAPQGDSGDASAKGAEGS